MALLYLLIYNLFDQEITIAGARLLIPFCIEIDIFFYIKFVDYFSPLNLNQMLIYY